MKNMVNNAIWRRKFINIEFIFSVRHYSEDKNKKDGFNIRSKYWQDKKKNIRYLPSELQEVAIGVLQGDGNIQRISNNAFMKMDQGSMHKDYLYHLYNIFKDYTFSTPSIRYEKIETKSKKVGDIKSYSFRTFSHPTFNEQYDQLMIDGKKTITYKQLDHPSFTARSLTYWIMDDGSQDKNGKRQTLHTQSFSYKEITSLRDMQEIKFNLKGIIKQHKNYWVLVFPSSESTLQRDYMLPFIHNSMLYKLPKIS